MKENKERRKFRKQQLEKKEIGRKRETERRAGAAGAPGRLPQRLRQSLTSVRSAPRRFVLREAEVRGQKPGAGGISAQPRPRNSRRQSGRARTQRAVRLLRACLRPCAHTATHPDARTPPGEGSVRAAEPLFTLDFISTAAPGAPRRRRAGLGSAAPTPGTSPCPPCGRGRGCEALLSPPPGSAPRFVGKPKNK